MPEKNEPDLGDPRPLKLPLDEGLAHTSGKKSGQHDFRRKVKDGATMSFSVIF